MNNLSKPCGSIKTEWEIITYDVWGNEKEGFEVNNAFRNGTTIIHAPVTIYNYDTSAEFRGASPNKTQIRKIFGLKKIKLEIDGDDLNIYVNKGTNSMPLGELRCISHDSLSPIRKKVEKNT